MESSDSIRERIRRLGILLDKPIQEGKLDSNGCLVSRETLLDALILLYDECNNEFLVKDQLFAEFIDKYRATILQLRDLCINFNDFEIKKIIGKGRFAEVAVVKEKCSDNTGVLKKIRKSDILNAQEGLYFENERNLLISASSHPEASKWLPRLFYSFQDMKFIYYFMEYCPGGNLCTMLEYYKKNVPEPMIRFYSAEMIQAIHCVHLLGYVHRDIKPDNILIDANGHLKLIDFGSSAKMTKTGQVSTKLILSNPHYTAPEIFKFCQVSTIKSYGAQCDWWSLGIVLFELITGQPPFTSDEMPKLHLSSNYSRKLHYAKQVDISQDLKTLICGLIQPVDKRSTYEKLIKLKYFEDVDWNHLHERDPLYVPLLSSSDDTTYFSTFEVQRATPKVEDFKLQRRFTGRNLPFLGFSYLWSEPTSSSIIINHLAFPAPLSKSSVIDGDRRKTEHFDHQTRDGNSFEVQRHSINGDRMSAVVSECSNDSFQSAASEMYNCLTDDQRKYVLEKELLTRQIKEKEMQFQSEKERLDSKNKNLEDELHLCKEKMNKLIEEKEKLKAEHEDQLNKLRKSDKLKKDALNKLNFDMDKYSRELTEKTNKLKDTEDKLMSLSNQQAAKLAMLSKTRTTLRSKSLERDKYEQENQTLKDQLTEANKKICKLNADIEKKGKMKVDLEVKMIANKSGVEFKSSDLRDKSMIDELREKLQQKEVEYTRLAEESNEINQELDMERRKLNDIEFEYRKLEDIVKKQEKDYTKVKMEYDVLFESNLKTEQYFENVMKKLSESEDKNKHCWSEINTKENEIQELKRRLRVAENTLRNKQEEINNLKDELHRTEADLFISNSNKKNILDEGLKNDEIQKLKEIVATKTDIERNRQLEFEKLKKSIEAKNKDIADLNEQIIKLNENMFSSLVTIEELKTTVEEKSMKTALCENEISNLKRELRDRSEQVSNIRTSLNVSDKEKKMLESKIESLLNEVKQSNALKLQEIETNKIDPKELIKQFECTIKDVLKENLNDKENVKSPNLESMLSTVQRKLSILSERPVVTENVIQKSNVEPSSSAVFELQIERLESQLEKARENAVLQREAASQAKKELATAEKQLSDLKIDLRIAQREARAAEEQIKTLQKSKYTYYKELKEEKETLERLLKEGQQKLSSYEEELANFKHSLEAKNNDLNERESSLKASLKEIISLSRRNDELFEETKKLEFELHRKTNIMDELTLELNKFKEVSKQKETELENVKKETDDLKRTCSSLKENLTEIKDVCEMLDQQNEDFQNIMQSLNEEVKKLERDKQELLNNLDQVNEELKSARKSTNEEKSLKIFAENRSRTLESDLERKNNEIICLENDYHESNRRICTLEERVQQLEDYISTANDSIEKGSQYTDLMKKEIASLKQDRTDLLTRLHCLKEENAALRNELKEATDDLNDLQQANGELQSVLTQVETYHEIRHLKDNATLQQHSKLIEFLQNKFDAARQKRTLADKLFRSKGKENLNPKELENLLHLERNKSKGLAEQLYQARIELMMLKGDNVAKCTSPKLNKDLEQCLTLSSRDKQQPFDGTNFITAETPVKARLKHNIPHKFDVKICTKTGCKCVVCSQPIVFGHKMSNCKECHVWCHVSCSVKVGPTCGMSQAMLDQITTLTNAAQSSSSLDSSPKSEVEGTIHVLKNKIWEKMSVVIRDKELLLLDKSNNRNTKERILLETIYSVDDTYENIALAMENISDNEKCRVLRILYRPKKNVEDTLYMLASSEDDKVNWLNVLKRHVKYHPSHFTVSKKTTTDDYFKGKVVCEFDTANFLNVNEMVQLSPELCILIANEGIFSLKLKDGQDDLGLHTPVKIAGVDKMKKIKILTKLRMALLICEDNDSLKRCDLRMLVSNAEAAKCSEPCINVQEVSNIILNLKNCRLVEVSRCNTLIAVVTVHGYLMILQWKDGGFDVMKFKKKISNVKCMLFTKENLLFAAENELYSVDLTTFTENKIPIFKRFTDSKQFEPEAIVKISATLYLLCDKYVGVFMNEQGKYLKSLETLRWPFELKQIVYNKPFLCIAHEESVSLIYLPSSTENPEEKFKFSSIRFSNSSILGVVKEPVRGIYLRESEKNSTKLFFLDPIVFMKRNPKHSWSSISTQTGGETTEEENISNALNISDETEISLNSSILDDSSET